MIVNEYQEAWQKVLAQIAEAGMSEDFHAAVMKSAEAASRAAAATYENERTHLRMSVRAEFCYELADGILRAQEASETAAKVKEAERIREELASE